MSGGSQHNPNGRQPQLGAGWSHLQVANFLARAPQAHMGDRGVTWHTPTPPPHLYHVPAPSPPDPLQGMLLQAMKSGGNSVFRHTNTPPDLYRHTPTPPDKHLMRHTPSPGDVKGPAGAGAGAGAGAAIPPAEMLAHLPPREKLVRPEELMYGRGVDLSVGGARTANGSPAPPAPAPPPAHTPPAPPAPPALSVRDASTINTLIARAQPRPGHARVDALLERLSVPAAVSPHSVIVHPRVAPTPSPPSSNEDSADSFGAPPGSKRKRKPERTIRVPTVPPVVTAPSLPLSSPITPPPLNPTPPPVNPTPPPLHRPPPVENGDAAHHTQNGPQHTIKPENTTEMPLQRNPPDNPKHSPANPKNSPGRNPKNSPANTSHSPGRDPKFHPGHNPDYDSGRNPDYNPGHNPDYNRGHNRDYNLGRNPNYNPEHNPNKYSPGHDPKFNPGHPKNSPSNPKNSPPNNPEETKENPKSTSEVPNPKVPEPEPEIPQEPTPVQPEPHTRRKTRSNSAETLADIAAMVASEKPPVITEKPPENDTPVSIDNIKSILSSEKVEEISKSPKKQEKCDPNLETMVEAAAAPKRRRSRTSNTESTNVPVESPSEAKPAEQEPRSSRSLEPTAASFVEVEKQLENMFAGLEEERGDRTHPHTPHTNKVRKRRKSAPTKGETPAKVGRRARASVGDRRKGGKKKAAGKPRKHKECVKDAYAYDSGSNASSSRSRGPYIQIRGPRDSPLSVSVINAQTGEDETDAATSRRKGPDEYRNGLNRARGLHASTLGLRYDATTPDATWLCAFCERGPHAAGLGDLFGPYTVDTDCEEYRMLDEASRRRYESAPSPNEVWFHELCAVWAPGLIAAGARLWGLAPAVWGARGVRCGGCGRAGAAIACHHRACRATTHVSCAHTSHWLLNQEDFRATCPRHA